LKKDEDGVANELLMDIINTFNIGIKTLKEENKTIKEKNNHLSKMNEEKKA
jgi:hypothetical protein